MPSEIHGEVCYTLGEVADLLDITRQTLWRWRKDGRIPIGRKYRGREIVLTAGEVELTRAYSLRVEPIEIPERQLTLFHADGF